MLHGAAPNQGAHHDEGARHDLTPAAKPAGPVAQCFQLWDSIADGELIPRCMAVELAVANGINQWTARTQFQRWFTQRQPT